MYRVENVDLEVSDFEMDSMDGTSREIHFNITGIHIIATENV